MIIVYGFDNVKHTGREQTDVQLTPEIFVSEAPSQVTSARKDKTKKWKWKWKQKKQWLIRKKRQGGKRTKRLLTMKTREKCQTLISSVARKQPPPPFPFYAVCFTNVSHCPLSLVMNAKGFQS